MNVFDASTRASASNMPMAEKFPGSGGMMMVGMESSRARAEGVERSPAAIGEQYEVAGIETVFDGNLPNGAAHHHGRKGHDAIGDLDQAIVAFIAERCGNFFGKHLSGGLQRQRHLSTEETIGD